MHSEDRCLTPTAHAAQAAARAQIATGCTVSQHGGGMKGRFGEGSGSLEPIAIQNFRLLRARQRADRAARIGQDGEEGS